MARLDELTIRRATDRDLEALDRLAGLDSTRLPVDEFLIAEVAGEPWAAVGIASGAIAADPFRPTADVAALLRLRAERARDARSTRGLGLRGSSPGRSRLALRNR
jgi:hypothetical protein